jgi:ribonuclease BN (tRNA processing enzyme)
MLVPSCGDTNGEGKLVRLAKDADLFIAHNAVPEGATGVERRLHMPPSVIGQIAQEAHVKQLVSSHRTALKNSQLIRPLPDDVTII